MGKSPKKVKRDGKRSQDVTSERKKRGKAKMKGVSDCRIFQEKLYLGLMTLQVKIVSSKVMSVVCEKQDIGKI